MSTDISNSLISHGTSSENCSATSMCDVIDAKMYSGCYGGETGNVGDIIVTTINCPLKPMSLNNKQIIFVVDESGSMSGTIPAVRASLFAARNALLRLGGYDISTIDEPNRDILFSKSCNSSIITFSDNANCKWESEIVFQHSSEPSISFIEPSISFTEPSISFIEQSSTLSSKRTFGSFTEAVNNICADSSTNMGDALKMAFQKHNPLCATWIILLTDGMSNKGPCQTKASFEALMNEIPSRTKIIPLGYTAAFDPEVLSTLGNMTYIETEETIAEVLGGIVAEIVTCYGFDAKITLPSLPNAIINPEDNIMVPDVIAEKPRDIIGSGKVGCLFNERKFTYGHLPWGNFQSSEFSQYIGSKGNISYFDLDSMSIVNIPFTVSDGGSTIPDNIREDYFASSKGRILLGIYQAGKLGKFTPSYVNAIKAKLEDWKHPTAATHKEEILRILNNTDGGREEQCNILSNAVCHQNQTNYTTSGRHATNTQRATCGTSATDANVYSITTSSHEQLSSRANAQPTTSYQPNVFINVSNVNRGNPHNQY
ncbi:Hypothetical protein HVR_LOCUS1181 [uncultured virus]|nr:Hypothetical protein HVR_LOCUS1181 [uncultured virus]